MSLRLDAAAMVTPLQPHPLRAVVAREVHARPFHAARSPARFLHFGFMTNHEEALADRAALSAFCAERGVRTPTLDAKHHRVGVDDSILRWEQHSEFTTYTWEIAPGGDVSQQGNDRFSHMQRIVQQSAHLVSIDLHLVKGLPIEEIRRGFDPANLAVSAVDEGAAILASDFRCDEHGFVRIVVVDCSLTPERAGALVQRVLELETYRMLALLGLPEAQRLAPRIRRIEEELIHLTRAMTERDSLAANHELLDRLTALAATLEADAAASLYRFGASRAYYEIVQGRLSAICERTSPGYPTIAAFLSRRLAPAMRTCTTMEERQANLSRKLSRAAQLLRTRVEIELQQHNRALLSAMNERTRLQLRLQQTVEGLSIVAVSYYVVALLSYVFKGLAQAGIGADPTVAAAWVAPFVVVVIAVVLRRATRHHRTDAPESK